MKKLTAIICMIAVVGMMALTACSVEQALTSDTAPARTPVTSIDDLDDTGFECVEIDATLPEEESTTTAATVQTEAVQPDVTRPDRDQATDPTRNSTTQKPATTQKPTTEAAVVETTTTQKMAVPTMAETTTTKKPTTTTEKPTTTTKSQAGTTTQKPTTQKTTTTQKPTTTTKKTTTTTKKPANPTYNYTTGQKHTARPYTQRYHYNLLDATQKELYALIAKAVNNLETQTETFVVDDEHEKTFRKAFLAFHNDHPEHFYLARYYGVVNYGGNKHQFMFLYAVAAYDVDPSGSNQLFDEELSESLKNRIRTKKAAFDKEVNNILSTIPANAPAVVKEKMAYETILKACRYNLRAVEDYLWDGRCEDNWTAYGIMVNKTGVCESYSEAFQTLCLQMGINAIPITGSTSGGGHMWNAVELDDGWYMCDITFDDPIGGGAGVARFDYFNRTSLWMQEHSSHNWFMSDFAVPKCTKSRYAYENYFA